MNRGGLAVRAIKWGGAAIIVLLIAIGLLFVPIVNLIISHELPIQIEGAVDAQLDVGSVSYAPPLGLTLSNLHLIPTGSTQSILDIGKVQISLAKLPLSGPDIVSNLDVTDPVVHLKYLPTGQIEFPQLRVKTTQSSSPAGKLSDVIQLQHGSIQHVVLELDEEDGAERAAPTVMGRLDATIALAGGSNANYQVTINASQPPLLTLSYDGQLNADTGLLAIKTFTLQSQADHWDQPPFPPAVALLLNSHHVTGVVDVIASGSVPLNNPQSQVSSLQINLNRLGGTWEGVDLALAQPASASVESGAIVAHNVQFNAAGGAIHIDSIQFGMLSPFNYGVKLAFEQIDVKKFRPIVNLGSASNTLSGTAEGTLTASGQLVVASGDPLDSLNGSGSLEVKNADFWDLPTLDQIAGRLNTSFSSVSRVGEAAAVFEFGNNKLHFSQVAVSSPALGVQGSGSIGRNGDLDMSLVAVPLADLKSQMNQSGIPILGNVIGSVQDVFSQASKLLYKFHITGKVGDPKVTPVPAPALTKDVSNVFGKMINSKSAENLLQTISSPFKSDQSK